MASNLLVPVGSVQCHPRNVREGDVGAISESLVAHGQYRAIVVQRSSGNILAGNHTFRAAVALGWSEIWVSFHDCDDGEALRIMLVDNRLSDLAVDDEVGLVELLRVLAASDEGLAGTGFDLDDLDSLVNDLAHFEVPKEVVEVPVVLVVCPSCGCEFEGVDG